MRTARALPFVALLALAGGLAACSGGASPGWTFSPTQPPTPAPSGGATPAPSGSPAPSGAPSEVPAGTVLRITAANVAYDVSSLEVPADTPFSIEFTNNDPGIPHNVAIHGDSPTGPELWQGDIVTGVTTITYQVAALPAGTYGFVCTVHPNMTGTLTVK